MQNVEVIYRDEYRYKKAAVMMLELAPVSQMRTNLYDRADRERSKRLIRAMDGLNAHKGAGTLRYAAAGLTQRWRMRFARRSPSHTTN